MKVVVQRVEKASVKVDNQIIGAIGRGLLLFLGVGKNDTEDDIKYFVNKILNLRIFEDETGKMNLSVSKLQYDILIVSQFTLYGNVKKGFRPNFFAAANPEKAEIYYNKFVKLLKNSGLKIETGQFRAMMKVEIINDGPVTIII